MYRFIPMFLVTFATLQVAQAQQSIQWRTDVPASIGTAQQSQLPLMFYVLGRNEDRDDKLDNAQKRAFTDPTVLRYSKHFVTARLSRSVNRDLLKQLGLPESMTQEIAFVTPDGKLLDRLSASSVADPKALLTKMQGVFDSFRRSLFVEKIQPVLGNTAAKPEELQTALTSIRNLNIVSADGALIAFVERPNLDKKTLFDAYDVLAVLSTKQGMEKLVELVKAGKPHADEALSKTTPVGAALLAEKLEEQEGKTRVAVYNAICKACELKDRKTPAWWERAEERLVKQEIERAKAAATDAVERWKTTNDE